MENKHAYLIMAHNDFQSLKHLMQAIDDERNDIYLHIDKKTRLVDFNEIKTWVKKAGLFFVPRIKVFWGDKSFVQCELNLLKAATGNGHYRYYHFLSGIDFPLKSQDEIHAYFEDKDLEYLNYHFPGEGGDDFIYKIRYYYPFMRWLGRWDAHGNKLKSKFRYHLDVFNKKLLARQESKGVDRRKRYPDITFVKGDNWVTITDSFARFALSKERKIMKMARFSATPDELFLATLAYNSSYKNKIANDIKRLIDWNRGGPYEFVYEDLPELLEADAFFARKISYSRQPKLVEALEKHIGLQ
ncbi:beta-1,6-N-acetylglucosaminyltransferase [Pseudobutyrivibrio xylanivorans]|uniref:Peptide O-xylosyltransferase n=1 Tax=Pseudobutyrivibrio xylanivorans TaxID=185007 RepID=A0A1G5S1B2_PSEXY|nr:beta-1,6-N-acetylglucosaminyltransferase [Pseudobutyrivibrio xylanivorans]SCZ80175.1 Core-2/I-Branching enzyme [Pseudobutyrivibrio xylanivorans]